MASGSVHGRGSGFDKWDKGERIRDGVKVKGMAGRGRLSVNFHASESVALAWERERWPMGTWGRGHAW